MEFNLSKVYILDMPVLFKHFLIKVDKLNILEDKEYKEDVTVFIYDLFLLSRAIILDVDKPTPLNYIHKFIRESNLCYLILDTDANFLKTEEGKELLSEFAFILDNMIREFTKFIAEFNYYGREFRILDFSETTITMRIDMSN